MNDFFFTGNLENAPVMNQSYNLFLVFTSYIIASLASYVFLDIAGQLKEGKTIYKQKIWWLVSGAFAMGSGIWAMHFTGMLALVMPMSMNYEINLTLVSILAAILGSGSALYLLLKVKNLQIRHYIFGGILLGFAIASMHYLGMEAMANVSIQYIPSIFFLSIIIAFAASVAALWFAIQSNKGSYQRSLGIKVGSALIMGIGVCGMHYTGMAAAVMTPVPMDRTLAESSYLINSENLSLYVIIASMLITTIMIFVSTYIQLVTNPLVEKLQAQNKELIETKESLEKAKLEADAANEAKSSFLANVSHELRTPLSAIIGYSELMLEEAEEATATKIVGDLNKVISAAKHLLSLINDILDLSKIEANKIELYLEELDIPSFLNEIKVISEPQIKKNNNRLVINVPENIGKMYTDVSRIRACVLNLLSNAGKFTLDGLITLNVNRIIHDGQDWIKLDVTDTGIGMNEEQLGKLFQAFSQADVSTTRKFGGTGLGLYLTERFCKMLGGTITVTSTSGQGSTFSIALPAICPSEGTAGADSLNMPMNLKTNVIKLATYTVLVIDDDSTIHQMLEEKLKGENITLLHALTGDKGYKIAKEYKPDLVILDLILPDTDGWTLLSAFKSDPELCNINIILISVMIDKDLAYAVGATDYFQKPLDIERFKNRIIELMPHDRDLNILIVDDDPNSRQIIIRALKKLSATIIEANNGIEAKEFLLKSKTLPSLILLDLMMPEMDGFGLIDFLQKNDNLRQIPVIVITAKDLTKEERIRLINTTEKILMKTSNIKNIIADICHQINSKLKKINFDKN